MAETIVIFMLSLLRAYLLVGVAFGLIFVFFVAGRIDPQAKKGSIGFRLIILPGAIAFWPCLAKRLYSGKGEPPEACSAHRSSCGCKGGKS